MILQTFLKSVGIGIALFACCSNVFAQDFSPPLRPKQLTDSLAVPGGTQEKSEPTAGVQSPLLRAQEPSPVDSTPQASLPLRNPQSMVPAPWSQDSLTDQARSLEFERVEPTVDSSLQPATFQQFGTTPPSQQVNSSSMNSATAGNLLVELQRSSQQVLDRYQPMSLTDMLVSCDPRRHKEMVRQYWSAWHACAEYLFAADEVRWLSQLAQPRDESDRLVLEAANASVADAMMEKEIAVTRQLQLLDKCRTGPISEKLPWPSDLPMVGSYTTHYQLYAANGMSSDSLRMIDSWLPKQKELIMNRAETVRRCRSAIQRATQTFNQSGTGSATLLQALYLSRESHGDFSRSVAQYNREIAEYALTVKPYEPTTEKIVAMLLPASRNPTMLPGSSGLRQASLPNENAYFATPGQPGFENSGNGAATAPSGNRMGEFNGGQPAFQPTFQPQPAAANPPSVFRR